MIKSLFVVALVSLAACSREPSTPPSASAPVKTKPSPTIVEKSEVLNEARPGENQSEAEMRAMIRMDNLPCDRVIAMQRDESGGQVTCEVGQGNQEYAVDQSGKFSKR